MEQNLSLLNNFSIIYPLTDYTIIREFLRGGHFGGNPGILGHVDWALKSEIA